MKGDLITGITAFAFELKKYENYEDLGRYIGDIQFEVGNSRFENNKILFDAKINIQSAKYTTYFCKVDYSMKTKTILFNNMDTKNQIEIHGKACKNDLSTLFFL